MVSEDRSVRSAGQPAPTLMTEPGETSPKRGVAARDLRAIFDPASVAVVGASNDPSKWGNGLARALLIGKARRTVFFVNSKADDVLGHPTHRSLQDLPHAPELVVVAVPASGAEAAVADAIDVGARGIIVISAGFSEMGGDGRRREAAMTDMVRRAGATLIGPNCLGVVDTSTDLQVAWLPEHESFAPGAVAIISQSGSVGREIGGLATRAGIGVSRFVSVGNQADIGIAEIVAYSAADPRTEIIAIYCEDFRDGRTTLRAISHAVGAGKHVLVLAAGSNEASSRAALSHTGALTTAATVVAMACRSAGAIQVTTQAELVDVASVLIRNGRTNGDRVAVVTDAGGQGVITTDVLTAAGLSVARFGDGLTNRLRSVLSEMSATANPVDLAAANVDYPDAYVRAVDVIARSGEVDAMVLTGSFGAAGMSDPASVSSEAAAGRTMAASAAVAGVPLVVTTMYPDAPGARQLADQGIPVFGDQRAAARALALAKADLDCAGAIPDLPEEIAPDASGLDYFETRSLLERAGIPFLPARPVRTADEAVQQATAIGFPVVLKAIELVHKSDSGGVVLGLDNADAVARAFTDLNERLGCSVYSIEQMANTQSAVELLIGCRHDPRFGPLLLVGLGGIYVEVFADTAITLAPAEPSEVERMLAELAAAPLLHGARGSSGVDLGAVALAASRLSNVAAARPWVQEIEINPLLASPRAAVALDVRATTDKSKQP